MADQPTITKTDIIDALHLLGLGGGDNLFVHSSLSSIGYVDGGADAVVDALLDVLGPTGNLLVPTFTYSPTTFFDVQNSPGKTGKITEAVRRRPNAVRSWSPTHSVSVLGPEAEALTAGHMAMAPMAVGSPIDRLAERDGWVLLLGVGHRSNSTVHIGESHAHAPFLRAPRISTAPAQATMRLPSGEEVVIHHTDMPGCSAAFGTVEYPLRRANAIRDGKIGQASCQLMRGRAIIDATLALLTERMDMLLCTNLACPFCEESRRRIHL
ncbi:MAG: AAC(3) family N-acetyltransferase [Armatimonadota bacterium]